LFFVLFSKNEAFGINIFLGDQPQFTV